MPKSKNASAGLSYVEEVTAGTTPATPTMTSLPFASHDLDIARDVLEGTDIQPDEMQRHTRLGNKHVAGSITADIRKGDFDPFLESAMRSSFSANVLKSGTTAKYFTIEDSATDIGNFYQYKGMTVNSLGLSVEGGASNPVQISLGFMGMDRTQSSVTIADTLTPISTNSPFDHHSGSLAIGNVGASSAMCVTSISLDIARNYEEGFCVGDPAANELFAGMSMITGSFVAYYMGDEIVSRYDLETLTEIEFTLDDETGGNPYTFLLPSVKLTSAPVPVSGRTGPRLITANFTALYDATEGSNLVITRTA